MPKHTLIAPFAQFRGTIMDYMGNSGLVLFDTPKAGNVTRIWTSPSNPNSTLQSLMRGYLTSAANAYQAITSEQAQAWNTAAAAIDRTDQLNVGYELTGIGLFCLVNTYLLLQGQSIVQSVPTLEPGTRPVSITSVTEDSGTITVTADTTGYKLTDSLMLRCSHALPSPARRARRNELRMPTDDPSDAFLNPGGNTVSWEFSGETLDIHVGDYIGVEITPLGNKCFPGSRLFVPNIRITAA